MSRIYLTFNSSNLDLIDTYINSISFPYYTTDSISKSLELKTVDNVEICTGTIISNNTRYMKQKNEYYSCAIVTDLSQISTLDYLNIYKNDIPQINIIIDNTSYSCSSFISISSNHTTY